MEKQFANSIEKLNRENNTVTTEQINRESIVKARRESTERQ